MAQTDSIAAPRWGLAQLLAGFSRLAGRHLRVTVLLSVVLICGSFAAAAALQMQLGREQAVRQTALLEAERVGEIGRSLVQRMEFFALLASRFAEIAADENAPRFVPPGQVIALRNIVVLDRNGRVQAALARTAFPPLPEKLLQQALTGRVITATPDSLLLLLPRPEGPVVVELDRKVIFSLTLLNRNALATPDGEVLASGKDWHDARIPDELEARADDESPLRLRVLDGNIYAAATLPGWPVTIASRLPLSRADAGWSGFPPLYLFLLLGPAFAGAGLAMVFVHESERQKQARARLDALRAQPVADNRLLVRLAEAERRAHEAERSKSEFVAHMSHELRTPLNAIIGFSEAISHGFFGPVGHAKYVEYAKDIAQSGRELHGKIGDILEFAHIEAGRYPLAPEAIDLGEIAAACVDEMAGKAFSRRIALMLIREEQTELAADPRAARRVLSNLLSNALHFTPEGGKVWVEMLRDGGHVVARIRDTGTGFSAEEAARAATAFASFPREGVVPGIGLGLAAACALADRMGGEVRLRPNQGLGMTAEFRLVAVV